MEAQRTTEWFRRRLGYITGSRLGDIMKKGRQSDFSDTALGYINQLIAERMYIPSLVNNDEELEKIIEQQNVSSKAMRWGTEHEPMARMLYSNLRGIELEELGSCRHKTIPYFASSPDGYNMQERGTVEIKCPENNTFIKYCLDINSAEELRKVKPEYYWQCIAHIMCTDSEWCDFIAFSPKIIRPIHIVRVHKDKEAEAEAEQRINLANEYISCKINKLMSVHL